MYSIGDVVMYGSFGICWIESIEKRNLTGEEQEYYILKHTNSDKNIFYVPTDNAAAVSKMRPVCSKAEVDSLISHMNTEKPIWFENDLKRKEEYSRIIRDGNKQEIIRLIKTLYLRRKEVAKSGKKLHSSDINYLSTAENMLFEEFAYALDIDKSEVVDYIEQHIS